MCVTIPKKMLRDMAFAVIMTAGVLPAAACRAPDSIAPSGSCFRSPAQSDELLVLLACPLLSTYETTGPVHVAVAVLNRSELASDTAVDFTPFFWFGTGLQAAVLSTSGDTLVDLRELPVPLSAEKMISLDSRDFIGRIIDLRCPVRDEQETCSNPAIPGQPGDYRVVFRLKLRRDAAGLIPSLRGTEELVAPPVTIRIED